MRRNEPSFRHDNMRHRWCLRRPSHPMSQACEGRSDYTPVGPPTSLIRDVANLSLRWVLSPHDPEVRRGFGLTTSALHPICDRSDASSVVFHWYRTRVPPDHRTHLRTARRVWQIVVLATQTPLTILLPGLTAGGDLRDHAIRLMNRRGCHRLHPYCTGQGKTSNSNQPDHSSLPFKPPPSYIEAWFVLAALCVSRFRSMASTITRRYRSIVFWTSIRSQSILSANLASCPLAAKVSTTAICIAIRALPAMTSRCKLPSCPRLKAKLLASSINNLCNDDRVVGSRSTRSLPTNLERLRLLTNWAMSLMANPWPVPQGQSATYPVLVQPDIHSSSLCTADYRTFTAYSRLPYIHRGPSVVSPFLPANSALRLRFVHRLFMLAATSSAVDVSGYVIIPSPKVFIRPIFW